MSANGNRLLTNNIADIELFGVLMLAMLEQLHAFKGQEWLPRTSLLCLFCSMGQVKLSGLPFWVNVNTLPRG